MATPDKDGVATRTGQRLVLVWNALVAPPGVEPDKHLEALGRATAEIVAKFVGTDPPVQQIRVIAGSRPDDIAAARRIKGAIASTCPGLTIEESLVHIAGMPGPGCLAEFAARAMAEAPLSVMVLGRDDQVRVAEDLIEPLDEHLLRHPPGGALILDHADGHWSVAAVA
jgi:hypothetical protein